MGIEGIGGPSSFGAGGGGGAGKILHTIQQGDTLDSIAGQYGLTSEQLRESNPFLNDLSELKVGTTLDLQLPSVDAVAQKVRTADVLEPYDPDRFGFNPQPDPPRELLDPGSIVGFNPQPEPPGGDVSDPGSLVGFNPQPDPPRESLSELNFKLAVDYFHITDQGHLLIKNEGLTGLFKSLSEGSSAPNFEGKTFSWGERPGEQLMFNFASEQINFEPQDFHVNDRGEGVIANSQVGRLFESVLQRQETAETGLLNFSLTTKLK